MRLPRIVPLLLAFVACLGYAALRYVVAGGTPAAHLPLYVTNKAVAVFALVLLGAAALLPGSRAYALARAGVLLAGLHALMTFPLLRREYFPKFFLPDGTFSAGTEAALATGAAALVVLLRRTPAPEQSLLRLSKRSFAAAAMGLTLLHCVLLGAPGWLTPQRWPGGLPPITLISAVLALATLVALLRAPHELSTTRSDSGKPSA